MSAVRIVGVILALIGVVATLFPHWFGPLTQATEPTVDLFEAVERRVRGGMIFALGLVLLAVPSLRPWSTSIPSAIFYLATGALAARLVGMAMEGAVPKQWMLVAVETILMAVAALWLWRSGATG